ncbi:acyl-CoA dehydrogenase-related protein [Dorcoceras hygrometricum]|uniref:Acyl-CoA dehydrogenase-related protein n=1 Tax=Dorcoceras hygrometricum TaxID=472368 RepID=A0A2Z7B5H8_9LAMI|nr:acyl-CoA dehydrogenase-related protein [Dorcoceras hygrometricum]
MSRLKMGSGWRRIQLAVRSQPLRLRNHNFGLVQRIMVKRLETSPHDPLGITDSACKNQLVVVSVQYGPFNTYIPIRSTTIGKSRVARDPTAMRTSWRSNSDIASVTRVSMTFRVVRTNQYNQDLGLIHSINGNHLESPNEDSLIDHQSTRSVLGKCVYLVTLAMSLLDLQDVCIAIGSLATLDSPMVVDLIGIYGLKGPYCTLTATDWFLQALSVIPRGSWGDVARRFTMIHWADHNIQFWKLSRSVRSDQRSELR